MRIDNYPLVPDRPPTPKEVEFWEKLTTIVLKQPNMEYADVVHAYRQLEQEFVNSAGDCEVDALETKRRIAETTLRAAYDAEQPFEVCRDAWNALVELGFSNIQTFCNMAWFYADSCLSNEHYDAGLAVLEPVLAEFKQWLQITALKPKSREFDFKELECLHHLRDGLVAYNSSEAEGKTWEERRDAANDARDLNYMDREGRDRELDMELNRAMDTIAYATWPRSFAETTRDYRQLETDFVARLQGTDEFFVVETKRRLRSAILMDAHKHKQPFDVCRDVWNDLVPLEFRDILQKCAMAWFFADCCLFNKEPDAGLAVIEPLITELRKIPLEDTDAETLEIYQAGLARLERLRDKLKALPT